MNFYHSFIRWSLFTFPNLELILENRKNGFAVIHGEIYGPRNIQNTAIIRGY